MRRPTSGSRSRTAGRPSSNRPWTRCLTRSSEAPRSGNNADDGLGLGLYIVRELTKVHGGEVSARSGGGETVFSVRLPRHYEGAPT